MEGVYALREGKGGHWAGTGRRVRGALREEGEGALRDGGEVAPREWMLGTETGGGEASGECGGGACTEEGAGGAPREGGVGSTERRGRGALREGGGQY